MWKKIPQLDWWNSVNSINLIRNMCYLARSPSLVQLLAIKYCSLWPTRFKNVRRATVYYVWWAGRNEVAFLLWHSVTAGHAAHLSIYRYIEKKNMIWSYTSSRQFSVSATKEDGFYAHLWVNRSACITWVVCTQTHPWNVLQSPSSIMKSSVSTKYSLWLTSDVQGSLAHACSSFTTETAERETMVASRIGVGVNEDASRWSYLQAHMRTGNKFTK